MKVRTTIIVEILKGDLDAFYNLKELKIEANHYLRYIEPGLFKNMSKLEHLSISFNTGLKSLQEGTFDGLINLKNLTLVNNIFRNIFNLVSLLKPQILPSLVGLDISENPFVNISKNDLSSLQNSTLKSLRINLCGLEYVHSDSFLPLKMLKVINVGQNNLNSSYIRNFLSSMNTEGINLTSVDLSGLGFRKQPPCELMEIVARTTISRLRLADNHFEVITDDTFPIMSSIEELDLKRVFAICIRPNAFDVVKFPNLQVLLLSGNNLHGIYQTSRPSYSVLVMDLSFNGEHTSDHYYYEIDNNAFSNYKKLRVLNLSYNAIKSIYNYTFKGLESLRVLNLQNSSIYLVGEGTFKPMSHLKLLNLADNPFGRIVNLTGSIFDGLCELKVLILKNCGITYFDENDNLFQKLPDITTLILRKNQLRFLTADIIKPLKMLEILDLRDNFFGSWHTPMFLNTGVRPTKLYMANNKITQFTKYMLLDINYLLENDRNFPVSLNFMDNVFVCDCNSMFSTYTWLKLNGSKVLREYFNNSNFLCTSPEAWESHRVAVYLEAIPSRQCSVEIQASRTFPLLWAAPALVIIFLVILAAVVTYKYRLYIQYWLFISKVALGRKFIRKSLKDDNSQPKGYKYDAFVSYSNEDKGFVMKMIQEMEAKPPHLKLCIYERDFEIGSFISESVSNSINESRYIILVISNSFVKSQWCRWETHLAEYHRLFLEDGTSYDPLVLIKIGDIENKYLITSLKYLLKTKIYHPWSERHAEEFWEKLRAVIKQK